MSTSPLFSVSTLFFRYLNGNIYTCHLSGPGITKWVKDLMDTREQEHYAHILTSFIEFIEQAQLKDRLTKAFFNTTLQRMWGEPRLMGEKAIKIAVPSSVPCYGIVPGYV